MKSKVKRKAPRKQRVPKYNLTSELLQILDDILGVTFVEQPPETTISDIQKIITSTFKTIKW